MQRLEDPNQSKVDDLNNARPESSRDFRKQKTEYQKAKIDEIKTKSKKKNIRDLFWGINDLKNGYQPTINIVKDEKGNLVTDFHST